MCAQQKLPPRSRGVVDMFPDPNLIVVAKSGQEGMSGTCYGLATVQVFLTHRFGFDREGCDFHLAPIIELIRT